MIPVELVLKNFQAFSDATIKFDFRSVLIVGEKYGDPRKSNGAAKSTIFRAIAYALYGKCGTEKADDIVKWGENVCEVVFDFIKEGQRYRIIRTRNSKHSTTTTFFSKVDENGLLEGDPTKSTGDKNTATNRKIIELIGYDYDVFTNSVYFQQNSFLEFVSGQVSARQKLMGAILDLGVWAKYQKRAKKEFEEYSQELKVLNSKIGDLSKSHEELEKANESKTIYEEDLKALELEEATLKQKLFELNSRDDISNSKNILLKIKDLKSNKLDLDGQINKVTDEISVLSKRVSDAKEEVDSSNMGLTSVLAELKELGSINEDDIRALDEKISGWEDKLLTGKAKEKTLSYQIKTISEDKECSSCGSKWDDDANRESVVEEKLKELGTLRGRLEKAQNTYDAARRELKTLKEKKHTVVALENKIKMYKSEIEHYTKVLNKSEEELPILELKLKDLTDRLDIVSAELNTLNSKDLTAFDDISSLEVSLEKITAQIKETTYNVGQVDFNIQILNKNIKEVKVLEEKRKEVAKKATVYSRLVHAFGKDGVPAIIIDNVVQELMQVTNYWMNEISTDPMNVSFVTQKKNTQGDWKETMDIKIHTRHGECKFSDLSGGEKFRVTFAIRLAISSILMRKTGSDNNLLLLDEVSSSLDPYGLEVFVSIIRKLEDNLKIMVITHDDNLKNEFDNIILVKHDVNGSRIEE